MGRSTIRIRCKYSQSDFFQKKYDMLVIGGGAGGLVTAIGSAGCGGKVAIIERSLFGGDCLNNGCVPSKAFLKCANVAHQVNNCEEYGVFVDGRVKINFPVIMERMRKIRSSISENDSAERLVKAFGIDVFLGSASFVDKNKVIVNGQTLSFSKCCLATGARPYVPLIMGLDQIPYYTSENIFNLTIQPKNMVIVGTGPVGCELGQAFQRLGTQVTFIMRHTEILPKEDQDA